MTDGRAALLYTLTFVPAGAATVALSGWLMDVSGNQAPAAPSGVSGWTLNIVPGLVIGLLTYIPLARYVGAGMAEGRSIVGQVLRCAALYIVTVFLGGALLHDASSPEFWMFGQITLWICFVAAAGILADGLTVLQRRHFSQKLTG